MKILFDNQIFVLQKYGGISRYFCELFKNFNEIDGIEYELPIRNSINEYLSKIDLFKEKNLSPHFLSNVKGRSLIYRFLDIFDKNSNFNLVKKSLKKQNFDIFHPTYYSKYFLKYLGDKKFVLTVYDMIHEIYPDYFKLDNGKTLKIKKELIQKANKIIAISENTKKDIINFYNIPEEKIEVIYLANSLESVIVRPAGAPDLPEKYILFVGSRDTYKNFVGFIKAVSSVLQSDKNLKIITTGGGIFSEEEKLLFAKLKIEEQIIQYFVNDEVLAYLYKNAICFVFPTLYEGFGIPVLESFACYCPAVLSNSSSLPEIGGDAAVYFNPVDSDSILKTVKMVVYDKNLRQNMILKGRKQLKKFSWDKTAKKTLELYSRML